MQWLLPSIADLIFIAFLGVLACTNLSSRLLGDAGIGWHIRTGQLILSTHSIPHVDPFSSSMPGHVWFAWEWLYDVIVGWLDQAAGLNGVVLLTAIVIAATFSWMFRLLVRRNTNLVLALLLILLAASASMIHFFARPHVVTWLFCVMWLWILGWERPRDELSDELSNDVLQHRRLLLLLPLSMLVWVNVHGGFLLGFALLALYWISAMWRRFRPGGNEFEGLLEKLRAGKRARDAAGIAFLSAVATFVNPYGWKLHVHIYRYLSNRFLMDHIDEFQSPNFHGIAQKCFALLLLLTLLTLATNNAEADKDRPLDLLLILFAAYSGLYAARNIPVASLLLIWVIGPKLSRTLSSTSERFAREVNARNQPAQSFFRRMLGIDAHLRGHLWAFVGIAISVWIAFHGGALGKSLLMNSHFDANHFPIASVDYLERNKLPASIFAPDFWGGYLIYRLYPQTKVVVDDRHDFYGEQFLKSYLKTVHVEPGWQDFLTDHRPGCILAPKSSALANILMETPSWKAVYTGETAIVFTPDLSGTTARDTLQLHSH
jgi:hypothetical protein